MRLRHLHFLVLVVFTALALSADQRPVSERAAERIQKEVLHELRMLPYVTVFDNLAFRVDGYKVTLLGQVTRPSIKSDAEKVVKGIEGVEQGTTRLRCFRFPRTTTGCVSPYSAPSTALGRWRSTTWA